MESIELEKINECNLKTLELQRQLLQENERYNSTVCSLGYISMLAILCYTHNDIEEKALIWILIFFGLSVFIFVIFEIIKTFRYNKIAEKQFANYDEYKRGNIKKHSELIEKNNESAYNTWAWFIEKSKYFFIASAIFGVIAGIITFVQLFLLLTY